MKMILIDIEKFRTIDRFIAHMNVPVLKSEILAAAEVIEAIESAKIIEYEPNTKDNGNSV